MSVSSRSVRTDTTVFQTKKKFEKFLNKDEKLKKHKQVHIFQIGIAENCLAMYALENGKEKDINKYDLFPPPLDYLLFYETIILIKYNAITDRIIDFTSSDFDQFIHVSHNGFDDCDDDERSDDETSTDLDGFIVHSDDEITESDDDDL